MHIYWLCTIDIDFRNYSFLFSVECHVNEVKLADHMVKMGSGIQKPAPGENQR